MARGLLAEPMGLIDQRLQDRHGIGQDVFRLAIGREGIGAGREELDPVRAMFDLIANRGARFLDIVNDGVRNGVHRLVRILRRSPIDAASRDLLPRSVDESCVDGVADIDIGIAIAVAAHVADRREAGAQIVLRVLDGEEKRSFPRHFRIRRALVEHMRVGVDQARHHGGLAEIDDLGARGNLYLVRGTDIGDAVSQNKHGLVVHDLTGLAVEQPASLHGHGPRRRSALRCAIVGPETGLSARPSPGSARAPSPLRVKRGRKR